MRYLPVLIALGACSGGDSSESLHVNIANTAVAAVRSGDTWKTVTPDATGAATIPIDGPTIFAMVCDEPDFFNYYTLLLGPEIDDTSLDFSCARRVADVEVTIVAPVTTQVYIGFASGYDGTLSVTTGTHDVVAIDDSTKPPRFEIRRDVAITAPTTLTFDLAVTGTPMIAARIDATGADAGEMPSRRTNLYTANRTYVYTFSDDGNSWRFPTSALREGDRLTVTASTTSETLGRRSNQRSVTGDETAFTLALPPYLTSVTATATSASWQGGTQWQSYYYGINSPDFDRLWDVSVFPEWAAAGGKVDTIAIPDPTTIPGWQAKWNLTPSAGYEWYFVASDESEPDRLSASRSGLL